VVVVEWESAQQKEYDDILAAVRQRLNVTPGGGLTRETWRRCGELGLLGLCIPEAYGGGCRSALDTAHVVEAFGRACPDTGLVFAAAAHLFACAVPVAAFGGEKLKRRLLPEMCDGTLVATNAMTEDGAGSDVSAISARAVRQGGHYVLSGEKSWASNAPVADVIITYAVTDPAAGFLGTSAFAVERSTPGVFVSEPFGKMGLSTCPAGSVRFTECRVPAYCLLGGEGQGGTVFQHSMAWERACLFAGYVGLMDRLLDRCVAHANERHQFGRRIASFQAVSHRIADMKLRLEAARLLLYRACARLDRGDLSPIDVAMSKLAVSEAVVQASLDAVQIFGARGYIASEGIESALRDSVPAALFSGTSEIQRELIAKGLGL
jgi:alkylation response protein AidB-like acyl-CoA dehydrogenase